MSSLIRPGIEVGKLDAAQCPATSLKNHWTTLATAYNHWQENQRARSPSCPSSYREGSTNAIGKRWHPACADVWMPALSFRAPKLALLPRDERVTRICDC